MALSINGEETSLAVANLSALTGHSMMEPIRQAIDEKLARMQTSDEQVEHILTLGRDCASRLPATLVTQDHGELLYGADGVPE